MKTAVVAAMRLAVLGILDKWEHYDWSVQGFGVLRLYINAPCYDRKARSIGRLHIWNSALRYPGVSTIHNHSWDLRSTVVCGRLMNIRFTEEPLIGLPYWKQRLLTGYQTEILSEPTQVLLLNHPRERYDSGDTYSQAAHEIHCTNAEDGTVTLMEREEDERGEADVYWALGHEWGNARPRPATGDEVHATVAKALARLLPALALLLLLAAPARAQIVWSGPPLSPQEAAEVLHRSPGLSNRTDAGCDRCDGPTVASTSTWGARLGPWDAEARMGAYGDYEAASRLSSRYAGRAAFPLWAGQPQDRRGRVYLLAPAGSAVSQRPGDGLRAREDGHGRR